MRRFWNRSARMALPGLAAFVLATGCLGLPTVAPLYTGGLAQEPAGLVAYESSGIRMAFPPAWKQQAVSSADSELKAQFRREGTSAVLQVFCQGTFVSRTLLPVKVLNLINADTLSNERLWPDRSLGGGNFDPEFSAWTGVAKDGSRRNYYIAWKLPSGFGCKYGVYMSVPQVDAPKVEGEFIAIARSLN